MRILKYITIHLTKQQVAFLNQFSIPCKEGLNCAGESIVIDNKDLYLKLKPVLLDWDGTISTYVQFSKKEILSANYCILYKNSEIGYPQPEKNFDYLDTTYDKSQYCNTCGMGAMQINAFQLNKISKSKLWGIHWHPDVLFTSLNVYKEIFECFNIKYSNVRKYPTGEIIQNLIQLELPITNETLPISNYELEKCNVCGRKKYSPIIQGFLPIHKKPLGDMYYTHELFGFGRNAFRLIYVSKELRDKMIESGIVKYWQFVPCK